MLVLANALTAFLRLHEKPLVVKGTKYEGLAELAEQKSQF